jgi:UDP-N-acetylglucosamine 2-epimerase (non-hydrolysing)
VHTGQHYDDAMSHVFFGELRIDAPDATLDVGSGSRAQQIARVIERLEPVLANLRPDLTLVAGDVNSTLGAALASEAAGVPIAHLEAGLRSFDRRMPEESNRLLTDALSSVHFVHSPEAVGNLLREGHEPSGIHAVGNTMIDTLAAMRSRIASLGAPAQHGLQRGNYLVVTLHRPALVDGPLLADALAALGLVSRSMPVLFPAHPRTRAALAAGGIDIPPGVRLLEPLGYLEFLGLVTDAAAVLTDSGGIQEETTYLDVPCFTLRDNTERPVTVELGTNRILGLDPARIADIPCLLTCPLRNARMPDGWDGRASVRVADVLERLAA